MLRQAPNATVNIYRGFNVAAPYPALGQAPAVANVRGCLKHHLEAGRFGFQDGRIKWTHLLLLDPGVDVRSAYNSWTGPAEPTQHADTVILADCPNPGNCCAFYVVLVKRAGRGLGDDHLRVYLDRLQPRLAGCFTYCNACAISPASWTLTLGNDFINNHCSDCANLNGQSFQLDNQGDCLWVSAVFAGPCVTPSQWYLQRNSVGLWFPLRLASRLRRRKTNRRAFLPTTD